MTWKEFKDAVERAGITDERVIYQVHILEPGTKTVHVFKAEDESNALMKPGEFSVLMEAAHRQKSTSG